MTDERRDDRGYEAREYKGPPAEELAAGYGRATLAVRGAVIIALLGDICLALFTWTLFQGTRVEHQRMMRRDAAVACVLLYDNDERKALRAAWQKSPEAVRHWCPDLDFYDEAPPPPTTRWRPRPP